MYLVDRDSGAVDLVAHRGLDESFASAVSHSDLDSSFCSLVWGGKPYYASCLSTNAFPGDLRSRGLRTLACVPVLRRGKVLACINLASRSSFEIEEEVRQALETIASQAGSAIARLRADAALRESERHYRQLVETSPLGIVSFDCSGRVLDANSALVTMMGSPSRAATKEINLFTFPLLVQAGVAADFERCAREGISLVSDHPYISKWGRTSHLRYHLSALRDAQGQVTGGLAMIEDLSALRATEDLLREERGFAQGVARTAQTIICVLDPEGRIVSINPYMERLSGYRLDEVAGRDWISTFLPERARSRVRALFSRAGGNVELRARVEQMIAKDGRELDIEWSAETLREADGSLIGVLATGQDLTERTAIERALRENETKYRQLFEATTDAVMLIDADTSRIVEANTEACRLYGYSREDLLQLTGLDISAEPMKTGRTIRLAREEAAGRAGSAYPRYVPLRWHRKQNGDPFPVEISTGAFPLDGRNALVVVIRDITDRLRAEDKLRHLTFHDSLTHLYNRAYFQEELVRLQGGREYPITVVTTDIDGLKLVNDALGHHKGDELLCSYAGLIGASFRHSDVVARVGGDEFSVLLPRTGASSADGLCRRLEAGLAEHNLQHPELPLSVSIGASTAEDDTTPLEQVLKLADSEMYRDKLRHGRSAQHSLVRALMTPLSVKDQVSEGHTARVKETVCELGRSVALSAREISELELLAEVHDLGKVGVPDHILLKPGPLTEGEREQMRQHSELGYRIARASPELSHVADLILHHHEWWNGAGYPAGLTGEGIPISCRILSIVDAYDAMTHDRPYRRAMGQEEALEELRRCAGGQFDPRMVEAFLSLTRNVTKTYSAP
jgi:diguanylate cyclase (GGDEF)-like protein/PAS domain S-box-containing protein